MENGRVELWKSQMNTYLTLAPKCIHFFQASGLRGGGKTYSVICDLSVGINIPTEFQMCRALGFSESIQLMSWELLLRLKKLFYY